MNDEEKTLWFNWFNKPVNRSLLPDDVNSKAFLAADDQYEFLNEHRDVIRGIPGAPKWKNPDLEKAAKELLEEYGSVEEIPEAYLYQIADDNKADVNELVNAFNVAKTQQGVDAEAKARKQREKELEGTWASALMTEAAKRRYIDDPERSVFYQSKLASENDPSAHPWTKTWLDRIGAGLGGMGAAFDLFPGPVGVFGGPIVRGARSVVDKVAGDDEAGWLDIGKRFGSDLGTNIGVNYAPTAILNAISRRGSAMTKDLPVSWKDAIWEGGVLETARNMKDDLKELGKMTKHALGKRGQAQKAAPKNWNGLNLTLPEAMAERQFSENIAGNTFAQDIKDIAKQTGLSEIDVAQNYIPQLKLDLETIAKRTPKYSNGEYMNPFPAIEGLAKGKGPAYKKLLENEAAKLNTSKAGKAVDMGMHAFQKFGPAVVKESANVLRDSNTPKTSYNKEYQEELKDIIKNTYKQWEAGFVPAVKPGDPMYDAYELYMRNKGKK